MATTILIVRFVRAVRIVRSCYPRPAPVSTAKLLHDPRQHREDTIDLGVGRARAEAETDRVLRPMWRSHCLSTCDGSNVPEEQAEPVDTRCPRDRAQSTATPPRSESKLMFVVFATRGVRAPLRAVPARFAGLLFEPVTKDGESRGFLRLFPTAIVAATPRPTMPATFSVPARRVVPACRPSAGQQRTPRRIHRRQPLRSVELGCRERQHVDP